MGSFYINSQEQQLILFALSVDAFSGLDTLDYIKQFYNCSPSDSAPLT